MKRYSDNINCPPRAYLSAGMTSEDIGIVLDRLWVGNCSRTTLALSMINHDKYDAAIMAKRFASTLLAAALRALANGDKNGCLDYLIYYRQFRRNDGAAPVNGDRRAKLINELLTLDK